VLLTAANQREREAKELADSERDEARKEKERADRNLAKARKAVEDYCTNVAEDKLLNQDDFYSLRKKLLATAVPFYNEFVEQRR
jgi:eukaryotic-like serine/threonine-protein kinase